MRILIFLFKELNYNSSQGKNVYHIIIAGGSGARFWPQSRQEFPKQLLKLVDNTSMIRLTADRLLSLSPPEKILIVASKQLCKLIHKEIPEIPRVNFMAEPSGKNTAPAIGLAAIHVYKRDPDAVMGIYPADHIISGVAKFKKAISLAKTIVENKPALVTIGIIPSHPATGYGYIQFDRNNKKNGKMDFRVKTFAEKPPLETAKKFLKSGDFLWNSGIFIWKAEIILLEIKTFMPELHESLNAIFDAIETPQYQVVLDREWEIIVSESIDYGILEKAKNVYTISAEFKWSDMGSWKSLFDFLKKDKNNNILKGKTVTIDTSNSLVLSPNRMTALIGVKDLAVINMGDATLVLPLNRAQDVKEVVTILREIKQEEYL